MNEFTIITNKVKLSNILLKSSSHSTVPHRGQHYYFSHHRVEHVQSTETVEDPLEYKVTKKLE